jgi:hypothetical protein
MSDLQERSDSQSPSFKDLDLNDDSSEAASESSYTVLRVMDTDRENLERELYKYNWGENSDTVFFSQCVHMTENDCSYFGEVDGMNRKHGRGIMFGKSGTLFIGHWRDGRIY